jgi:uncharacterized membrane protein YeaQ/YmgE (transglycosylase-associated protein family)
MSQDNPIPCGRGQAERPTWAAELWVIAEPVQAMGTTEATVPSRQVDHLITTFGIAGSIVTGTAGAVITLRLAPGLTVIALAELALALVGAVLIALCSRAHRSARTDGQPQDGGTASRAGRKRPP